MNNSQEIRPVKVSDIREELGGITRFAIDNTFDRHFFMKSKKEQYRIYYVRTIDGLVSALYGAQKGNSKQRNHPPPNYTKDQFKEWLLSQKNFKSIHKKWVESGYKKELRPSPDRLNDYLPYTFDNLKLVTCDDNLKKYHHDIANGINNKISKYVIGINKNTGNVIKFHSIGEASRKTGIQRSSITRCSNGSTKYSHAGGYIWRSIEYKKDGSIDQVKLMKEFSK